MAISNSPLLAQLRGLSSQTRASAASSQALEGQFGSLSDLSSACAGGCNTAWSYASSASMDDAQTDNSQNGRDLHAALVAVSSNQDKLTQGNAATGSALASNQFQLQQLRDQVTQLAAASLPGPLAQALQSAAGSLAKASKEEENAGSAQTQLSSALPFAANGVAQGDEESATIAADADGKDVSVSARFARDCIGQATQYFYAARSSALQGGGQQRQVSADILAAAGQLDKAIQVALAKGLSQNN